MFLRNKMSNVYIAWPVPCLIDILRSLSSLFSVHQQCLICPLFEIMFFLTQFEQKIKLKTLMDALIDCPLPMKEIRK